VIYIDFSKMSREEVTMYRIALRILCYIRVTKVTRMNGNIWCVVTGVMPSGILDTSDGDSWVVVFLVCVFVEHVRATNPIAAALIDEHFRDGFRVAVYGDDHVLVMIEILRPYLSEACFASYVKEFWDMEIRSIRMGLPIITSVFRDVVIEDGLIFLKRYLIDRPVFMPSEIDGRRVATVVPWKHAYHHFVRIPVCDDGRPTWSRWMLSIIGHAWDSMGTNMTAYRELAFLFQISLEHLRLTPFTVHDLLEKEMSTARNPTKFIRKLGLDPSCFFDFPSLKLLHSYHIYDASKSNKVDPNLAFGDRAMNYADLDDL